MKQKLITIEDFLHLLQDKNILITIHFYDEQTFPLDVRPATEILDTICLQDSYIDKYYHKLQVESVKFSDNNIVLIVKEIDLTEHVIEIPVWNELHEKYEVIRYKKIDFK